jgi:rRNA maturation endonuclease Nob1
MGFFENLGKRAERFKQEAVAASKSDATHGCTACETALYSDHDACPECGSDAVVELDRE